MKLTLLSSTKIPHTYLAPSRPGVTDTGTNNTQLTLTRKTEFESFSFILDSIHYKVSSSHCVCVCVCMYACTYVGSITPGSARKHEDNMIFLSQQLFSMRMKEKST